MSNYFISGLPRSGSTLLCQILQQNPMLTSIYADRKIGTDESMAKLIDINKPKIIVTYRPILEVLASFVKLANQYPAVNFIDKLMLEQKFPALSYRPLDDARCDWLMRPYGVIDNANTVFKNTVFHKEWFHLVTYEDLSLHPQEVISKVYDFLEIEHYQHDLENIPQHNNAEDKEVYGIPTLHTIRPQISKSSTKPEEVLSDYVIQKYSNTMDWFTKGWLESHS